MPAVRSALLAALDAGARGSPSAKPRPSPVSPSTPHVLTCWLRASLHVGHHTVLLVAVSWPVSLSLPCSRPSGAPSVRVRGLQRCDLKLRSPGCSP